MYKEYPLQLEAFKQQLLSDAEAGEDKEKAKTGVMEKVVDQVQMKLAKPP